jgi:large subunit ribosomal protein L4
MKATILTLEAAKSGGLSVIENGKGTQAVHDVVVAMRAARRSGTASTKTKADVNLSGAKPWRQKGTGRARAGYKSSPVWVGGGVVFGPHPRDYTKKVTRSVKRLALRKALSSRIAIGDVLLVDGFSVAAPKTKSFLSLLAGITPESKVLVVGKEFDENTYLSARNVKPVQLITASEVNTEQLLGFKKVILTKSALEHLVERTSK